MIVKAGEDTYTVKVADTEQERIIGLSDQDSLEEGKGLLMKFPVAGRWSVTMKDMTFPITAVFANDDGMITKVKKLKAGDASDHLSNSDTLYILEVNKTSAKVGDILEIKEEGEMILLDEEGKVQYDIEGGERIFSIKDTKKLVKMAKSAKTDEDYEKIGLAITKMINIQDTNEEEYV